MIIPIPIMLGGAGGDGSLPKWWQVVLLVLVILLLMWFSLCVMRWLAPTYGAPEKTLVEIIMSDLKYLSTKRIW